MSGGSSCWGPSPARRCAECSGWPAGENVDGDGVLASETLDQAALRTYFEKLEALELPRSV
jgi:hypothetical protein